MAAKRKHVEMDSLDNIHESRKSQVASHKKQKNNQGPRSLSRRTAPPPSGIGAIKKRIRDVSRRLERMERLPATVRADDERALAAYKAELDDAIEDKHRKKTITKYHMVRFFERQKATRAVKQARKRMLAATTEEEVEALKKEMHVLEVDLNYTQYSPLGDTYVSLYPRKGDRLEQEADDDSRAAAAKPPMWEEVERCMEDGTLDRLRNRRALNGTSAAALPPAKKKKKNVPEKSVLKQYSKAAPISVEGGDASSGRGSNSQRGDLLKEEADGESSDGGFFEK